MADALPHVYVFPDTNVLLHGRAMHEIPWCSLTGADRVTLVIGGSILAELDKKTHEGPSALRSRARKRARTLHKIRTGESSVRFRDNTSIEFAQLPAPNVYEEHELSRDWQDDRFLATVLAHPQRKRGACCIVTIDYNMTSRADALGLRWQLLDERQRLRMPPDSELAQLRRDVEILRQQQRIARIEVSSSSPGRIFEIERPHFQPIAEADMQAELATLREDHPKLGVHRSGESSKLGGALSIKVADLAEAFTPAYNAQLDKVYAAYEEYIHDRELFRRVKEHTKILVFCISNVGSAPAKDVQVQLELQAAGMKFMDRHKLPPEPKPPSFPKRGSPWSLDSALSLTHIPYINPLPRPRPARILSILDDTRALYEVNTLMHGVPENFEVSVFLDSAAASSGRMLYAAHADGQPNAATGHIPILLVEASRSNGT